jgi:hypothetical protein
VHRIRSVAAFAALFVGVLAREAHAAEPTPRTSSLSWVRLGGADACVSTQDLARGVETRLGRAVFVSAAQADLSVEGRIEPAHGKPGWRALLVLRDSKGTQLGTRALARDDASCDSMREPLVLVVALMIDPDASLTPPKPPPPPPPPTPQTIVVEKQVPVYVSVPVEASRPPDAPTWHFDAGASLATSVGLFGNPGLGGYVSGLLEPPGFIPLEGYGALWVDPASEGGPTFSLAYVGAGLCPLRYREGVLAVYACASGQLGYLRTAASSAAQLYLAGAVEGRLSVKVLGPIAARAGISLVVPVVKMASPVAATLDAGLGVILP